MASSAPASALSPAPARKSLFARIGAFLEALDGDHFAASDVRIHRLEQRVAQLERGAAQREA